MPTLRIPTPLRAYTAEQSEVKVEGATVSEAVDNLVKMHPALKPHLYNDSEELRPFVNLFLGEENIRDLQGLETPLKSDDRLMIIPSIAGG
ncbi:MAG: MoaD/ThiS family protein [Anaerolineales bacterium]|nr:MoaD/ThiS family protein [Anaerolineales bacterium]